MASSIIKKANARLKFLYRKRDYLTFHTKKLLVMALIQCPFDYACCFWFPGVTTYWKDKLQVTQNKLIRFVLNLGYRSHIDNEHFNFFKLAACPEKSRYLFLLFNHVLDMFYHVIAEYCIYLFVCLSVCLVCLSLCLYVCYLCVGACVHTCVCACTCACVCVSM
jgi:hypothetical protein